MTPENRRKLPRAPGSSPEEALAARRRRASEESLDVRWSSLEPVARLEVRNPAHRTSYEVLLPAFPLREAALCTCADFAHRGLGTCKHLEAAWEWLQDHPEPPEGTRPSKGRRGELDLWKEVDRGLEALSRRRPTTIRDLERAGELLFERPAALPERADEEAEETVGRDRQGRGRPTPTARGRP